MSWAPAVSYTLNVTVGGPGSGLGSMVTSSPAGIACNLSCSAMFADGTPVTLTPQPSQGWAFSGWGGACSGTGPCTVTMIGDRSVTASFVLAPPSGGGSAGAGGGGAAGGGGGGGGGGGSSSLALSVTPSSQTISSGGTAIWTIAVTNSGGAYLYAVGVSDPAAPGCGIPSSFADTASFMAPGVTISYNCSLTGVTGNLTNSVVATATTGPGDVLTQTATATVTVQAPPAPAPAPQTPRAPSTVSKLHTITGTKRADRLTGTAGADLINGLGGNDSINGGKGNDTLNGDAGNDTITGGPGHDTISGGPGKDLINARDHSSDTIDCGSGRDIVTADKADKVARNCEVVHRGTVRPSV
jgi:Ca2+-binding RTX toxin-like protein